MKSPSKNQYLSMKNIYMEISDQNFSINRTCKLTTYIKKFSFSI